MLHGVPTGTPFFLFHHKYYSVFMKHSLSNVSEQILYRVGVDVGTHSVGLCAVEIDDGENPIGILNSVVYLHDSGVDPAQKKYGITRRAYSGTKRRARRLIKRRKQRLKALDAWIESQGWPIVDLGTEEDPYLPWLTRTKLVTEIIEDSAQLERMLSVSLRHMARHRGWRNPYTKVRSLYIESEKSPQMDALMERVKETTGRCPFGDETPAQLVSMLGLNNAHKLRGPKGKLGGKLMQSDNANELRRISEMQGLSVPLTNKMIDLVFASESPRGAAASRVGKDVLPGQEGQPRAPKADEAFQKFRILSTIANIRVEEKQQEPRNLTATEKAKITEYLMQDFSKKERPTWDDVAEVIKTKRSSLRGTAATGPEGERPSSFPPFNATDQKIHECKVPAVISWWDAADENERGTLILELSNAGDKPLSEESLESVSALLESLSDKDLETLDGLSLPPGRAAYSRDSLQRLTKRMQDEAVDLFEARKIEFDVPDDWMPPADKIGTPVGNPAVDRVLKIVARWLSGVEKRWGEPVSINVEHVRSGLGSEIMARKLDLENNRRFQRNQEVYEEMRERMGLTKGNRSDLVRYLAIQRQNCQCGYCGGMITFASAEMDHIIPRAGEGGSTNTRDNLMAVCERCNKLKSNTPFASWADDCDIPGVSVKEAEDRVYHWSRDPTFGSGKEDMAFRAKVRERLRRRTEDPATDLRSMESVAWMANELHSRLLHHFAVQGAKTSVAVYRGSITAEARKASGLEGRINLIGGKGKTRLDRRHHAVDAAVISMMRNSVAKTLAQRNNLRVSQQMTMRPEDWKWKQFHGDSFDARALFDKWLAQMEILTELLNVKLAEDTIPIMQNLRLGFGNSRVHEDEIKKLDKKLLSSRFTIKEIDRASTPGLWIALTRLSDFDPIEGLPENHERTMVLNGRQLGPLDHISFFKGGAASVAVRGGYAELGEACHHARVYRINGKKPVFAMMRVYTVDLAKRQGEDLFSVELPKSSISWRTTEPKLRKALLEGNAEYLGWLVIGDEIRVDTSALAKGQIREFMDEYPMIESWRLDGFYSDAQLRLRPFLLASEGLEEPTDAVKKIVDSPGWLPAVNTLFGLDQISVVRRTALGEERHETHSGLPTCWSIRK